MMAAGVPCSRYQTIAEAIVDDQVAERGLMVDVADPAGILLIDVRTRAEVKYIGLADGVDANIPIRTLDPQYRWSEKKNTYRTKSNANFVAAVDRSAGGPGTRTQPKRSQRA